jgi:hypothetical protein
MFRKRSWTTEQLIIAARQSKSIRSTLIKLGLKPMGGNYIQIKKYFKENNIDTAHFTGKIWNKGLVGLGKPIWSLQEILVENSHYQSFLLKKRLFKAGLKPQRCEECGWAKMSEDGRIPLELDHINGNKCDNRIENLRILCPNCHSLKSTHRGLNRKARVL